MDAEAEKPAPEPGLTGIAGAILFRPREVGESVARSPLDRRVLAAVVLLVAIIAVSALVTLPYVTAEQLVVMRQNPHIRPDVLAKLEAFYTGHIGQAVTVSMQTVMPIIGVALIAFLLWIGQAVMGGQASFAAAFSVTAFACLISFGLGNIVRTALVVLKGSFAEVSTGLGILAGDRPMGDPVRSLLDIFDIFGVWAAVSAGAALAPPAKLSPRAAMGVSLSVYAGLSSIGALARMFSMR